ncbi:hypothetical protein DVH05_006701 [Phytophthora capsici]|nr:hypothetical protein DVH05_006701 [Phytophthora capsici]
MDDSEPNDDDEVVVSDSDIEDIQRQNTPLVKLRRVQHKADSDESLDEPMDALDTQGITFHPSSVDLLSCKFAPYVEFLATPAVLRTLYSFGFGLGLC